MPSGVKCTVSNCTFWDSGNRCVADSIQVEVDKHATPAFDAEFAVLGAHHQDHAQTSSTTCCFTFRPRVESE